MLQEPNQNNFEENAMTPEEINQSVNSAKLELERLNQLIDDLQDKCRHTEYDVKVIGVGPITLKNVCRCCQTDLGYPSKEDLKRAGY